MTSGVLPRPISSLFFYHARAHLLIPRSIFFVCSQTARVCPPKLVGAIMASSASRPCSGRKSRALALAHKSRLDVYARVQPAVDSPEPKHTKAARTFTLVSSLPGERLHIALSIFCCAIFIKYRCSPVARRPPFHSEGLSSNPTFGSIFYFFFLFCLL